MHLHFYRKSRRSSSLRPGSLVVIILSTMVSAVSHAGTAPKETLPHLTERASTVVIGRVISKPVRPIVGELHLSYVVFSFRFQPTQALKGALPGREITPEFTVVSVGRNPRTNLPMPLRVAAPALQVGEPYIIFLHDRGRDRPKWKVIGIRPYSPALVKGLQLRPLPSAVRR